MARSTCSQPEQMPALFQVRWENVPGGGIVAVCKRKLTSSPLNLPEYHVNKAPVQSMHEHAAVFQCSRYRAQSPIRGLSHIAPGYFSLAGMICRGGSRESCFEHVGTRNPVSIWRQKVQKSLRPH
jgi:hypothetical protein